MPRKTPVNTGNAAGGVGKRPDKRCKRGGQRSHAQRTASSSRRKRK